MSLRVSALVMLFSFNAVASFAQQDAANIGTKLLTDAAIKSAVDAIKAAEPQTIEDLDTVFPEGTDVKVKREGTLLKGPGIGDDCRGLAVKLAVIRAMNGAKIQTPGPITFVGTVGEEGLGDLRGVKFLFNEGMKGQIDRFVSIDGTGLGAHALDQIFDSTNSWQGSQRALLVAIALSQQ